MEDSTGSGVTAGVTTASAGSSAGTSSEPTVTTTDPTGDTETSAPGSSTTSEETAETTEGSSSSGGRAFVLCDGGRNADLRACYDFSDLGEGILTDLSTYGNHGTVTAVEVEAGPFGQAVRVAQEAEISVPDSASLDVEGPATWEAWILVDTLPTTGRVGILDNDGQYSIILYADGGLRCNGGGLNVFAPDVPVGQWVHVACTFEQGEMVVWVDGDPVDSATGGTPISTAFGAPLSIGDTSPDFASPLEGLVGGVRVWSEARSQREITEAADAVAR